MDRPSENHNRRALEGFLSNRDKAPLQAHLHEAVLSPPATEKEPPADLGDKGGTTARPPEPPDDGLDSYRRPIYVPEPQKPVVPTIPEWADLRPSLLNPDAVERLFGYMADRAMAAGVPDRLRLEITDRLLSFAEVILKATSSGLKVRKGEKLPEPPPPPVFIDRRGIPVNGCRKPGVWTPAPPPGVPQGEAPKPPPAAPVRCKALREEDTDDA